MSPLTAEQLAKRLIASRVALHGQANTLGVIGAVSAMLLIKRAADQPGLFEVPDRERLIKIASWPHSAEEFRGLLEEVEQHNPRTLGMVLTNLPFPKDLRPAQLREFAGFFSGLSLSDNDLEFSSTVGDAYDRFLASMADQAGKYGGESFTPAAVGELMVRITAPRSGQSVCDPFSGVAGFLTAALHYVQESEGRTADVGLFGQEVNVHTWAIAKANLLLHNVADGGLRVGDTFADPARALADGSLMRFDRVMTHAPFSMDYDKRKINRPELMRFGEISDRGKADPLIIQHVISILEYGGLAAMLIPLGVLFRSGTEADIRRHILEEDRVDAVIGLGSNFLSGSSIPVCILVLRNPNGESDWRRGQVLFINAESEITGGRIGNRLTPEVIEKIVDVFQDRPIIPGFSRVVSIAEIAENGFNLSVRPYTDQDLPEESPADTMALLSGGVPKREFDAKSGNFRAFGIDLTDLFVPRDSGYLTFPPEGYKAIAANFGHLTARREDAFAASCQAWWVQNKSQFEMFANERQLLTSRPRLIEAFRGELRLEGLLDDYQLGGAFAAWWSAWHDDLRTMETYGFQALIDRWRASGFGPRISRDDPPDEVLDFLGRDLCARAKALVIAERQKLVDIYVSWGERYGISLLQLEAEAQEARGRIEDRLRELGYVDPWGP